MVAISSIVASHSYCSKQCCLEVAFRNYVGAKITNPKSAPVRLPAHHTLELPAVLGCMLYVLYFGKCGRLVACEVWICYCSLAFTVFFIAEWLLSLSFSLYDVYEQLLDSIHSTFIAKISGYQCRITMYVHRESVLYWMVVSFSQRSGKVQ